MIVECLPHEISQFIEAIRVLVNQNIACPTSIQFVEILRNIKTTEYFAFHNDNGDFTDSYDEIFDVINLSYTEYEALRFKHKTLSGKEFRKEIFNKFNIKIVTNSNKVETNVSTIPLEIAKEMYKSENKIIHDYILTLYKESELKDPPYAKYKTVQDVVGYTDTINSTGPNFLTCLREKLNEGIKINYLKDPIYIPIIKVVENRYADDYLEDQIREKFSINGKQYCLVTGTKNEYLPVNGLFNIQKDSSVGAVSLHCGYLAFASTEIAMHAAKYFAKEIFEATMWGYSKDIVVKWLMND